nr:uncharacterized mitochondrial protein AtMg00810-like [Tanacetum cinerariifolium]
IDTEKPLLKDPNGEDVDVHTYRSMIGSLMYLTSSRPDIMFAVCACARFQVTPKASHLYAVKRIFRYLKGKTHLGLWYPSDSPFDLVAFSDSDYAVVSLDRKSITGGCQFLRCRLISWQCKKQTTIVTSSTEAEYVAAASCYAQVLWIQNQLLDYGYNFMHTIIYIDNSSTTVNTPRSNDDRLELMELMIFLLPSDEKGGFKVSDIDLQVSAFWTTVAVKKVNVVTRLQALVDKKKVVVTEAIIRDALRLDDAEGVECLPNEEIFAELARMGYEKPFTKLTFYKAFFSSQWKKQVGNLSTHTTKYTSPALTQKVFANMRRVGDADENVEDVNAGDAVKGDVSAANDEDKNAQALEITKLKQRVKKLERRNKVKVLKLRRMQKVGTAQGIDTSDDTVMDDVSNQERMIVDMDADADVVLEEAKDVAADAKDSQDADVQIIIEVVTIASTTITAVDIPNLAATTVVALTLTAAPSRRTKGNVAGFKMDYFKGMSYDDIRPIFEAKFDSNVAFIQKTKEQINEEESRALKRINKTLAEKTAKRQKLHEEVEELKRHLQIVLNEDDDIYIEATPLARKVPVVDYEIYNENNKPYFKIKRADEDLEVLWQLVKERFATAKPKNFSNDFLLITLGAMFEKPDIHAQIWKNKRSVHGQAKFKS